MERLNTRAGRLFMGALARIETDTRVTIRQLTRKPRGWHLGQEDMESPLLDILPDRYADRYDRDFAYRMLGSIIRLRERLNEPHADHHAHSVIEEILIRSAIRDIEQDTHEDPDSLEDWLEDWLGDLDIDLLYDPRQDENMLGSGYGNGTGDMRFNHWFDDQYWTDNEENEGTE
ncbi:hypothetical protein [Bifidobacterium saguini]|nr:hypothetical protein [Bifidobacterium saguini]